jgi:hypothetical protein
MRQCEQIHVLRWVDVEVCDFEQGVSFAPPKYEYTILNSFITTNQDFAPIQRDISRQLS